MDDDNKIVYAFIDASNLFYGGEDFKWILQEIISIFTN